jgi:filamentous hemagglutinin family protein
MTNTISSQPTAERLFTMSTISPLFAHEHRSPAARRFRRSWLSSTAVQCAILFGAGILAAMPAQLRAEQLPSGGKVTAGSASIQSGGNSTTITQTSDRAVINWNNFSVANGNEVIFRQPNQSAATLNRVTGNEQSTIAGRIRADGSVYIVNPNGILITSSGTVQTGGAFVASSLDISDADFQAGRTNFLGKGASARVTNAGSITAGQGAYVALLGGAVSNSGSIVVPQGKLALGSGEQIALDLNGGNFLQVAVPTSLLTRDALVSNSGTITASGGLVELRAAVLKDAIRNVVNMSGSINADSAIGDGGRIVLLGGADQKNLAGNVSVTGTLSARATGATGNGGFVETSGQKVDLNTATVTTLSANGRAGTWLIDPVDFTVAARGGDITGANLTRNLANGNVTILSNQGAVGTNGDININDAVSWSANTLTLDAFRDINVNAIMNATGTAGFVGIVGDVTQTGVGTSAGNLDFGMDVRGFYGKLNLASTGSFRLNGQDYVIITSLGAEGSTTGTDLQGINGTATSGFIRGNFVLGADIDASATSGWNGGLGFLPIGLGGSSINEFTGQFNGLGHLVTNMTINRPDSGNVGMFAALLTPATTGAQTARISNVGLVGGSFLGGRTFVGSLVADVTRGSLRNVLSTARVTGGGFAVGGLAGNMDGTIFNAFATGEVTADGVGAGGLVGTFSGSIDAAFATGDVTGCNRVTACFGYGGLVGQLTGNSTLSSVFATGDIAGFRMVGGLVGQVNPGTNRTAVISDAYANGDAFASDPSFASAGGLIGQGSNLTLNRVFSSGAIIATPGTWVGGIVGENDGTVTINNGYWNETRAVLTFSCGRILCSGTRGLTTEETRLAASFAGWDVNGTSSAWRNYEGRTAPLLTALMTPAFVEMAPASTVVYNGTDQTATVGIRVVQALNGGAVDPNKIFGTAGNNCVGGCTNAGSYTVTGTSDLYSDQFGYNLIVRSPLSTTLTITPAVLQLTYLANAASGIYGSNPTGLGGTFSANGLVGSDLLADVLSGTASWTTTATSASGVGSYAITGGGLTSSNGNYTISAIQAAGNATAYTVTPRAITVTANALSRLYGAANPALTFTVGGLGLVNGDVLAGALATSATSASNIGTYAITQGSLANSNYAISYVGADLTVNPAALLIRGNNSTAVYNAAVQTNGFTVAGLLNDDTVTGVSGLGTGTNVGNYADNLSAAVGSGLGNYTITYVNGELSLTPAALRIIGNSASRVYNGIAQTNGFTVSGLLGADQVTGVNGLATGTNAGTYADNLSAATGSGLANYNISYVNNGLTITPAALQLTYLANATSGIYGSNPSGLGGTFSATGLVGNDLLADVLGGTATWTTTATSASGVGTYAITGSGLGLSNGNYTLTALQAAGNASAYTVTPRAITVTANALSRLYGAANPALTFTVGGLGLVNGDSLSGALATSATSTSNIGTYAITQGTLANSNYVISYNGANLTVSPASLTITGDRRSVFFNGRPQFNGFTVSGLLNADAVTGVSGLGNGTAVGTYSDNLSTAVGTGLGNYIITYVNGALTINAIDSGSGFIQFLNFTENSGNGPTDGAASAKEAKPAVSCSAETVSEKLRSTGQAAAGAADQSCPI